MSLGLILSLLFNALLLAVIALYHLIVRGIQDANQQLHHRIDELFQQTKRG